MIHPSYSELIQAINNNSEEDDNTIMLNSRYSLVLATSKRAREIIGGAEPMVEGAAGKKPLSVAIDEFYKGKVKILAKAPEEEEKAEETAAEEAVGESAQEEPAAEETAQAEETEETPSEAEETPVSDEA